MSASSAELPGLFAGASPEFLLAAACCIPLSERRSARIDTLLAGPIDWPAFLAQVDRHRIPGLAARALGSDTRVPAETRTALSAAARANALANLRSLAVLSRVNAAFRAADIPFAVLKGLPLSFVAFKDIALRHSRDIDLLVRPQDTDRADALLIEIGLHRIGAAAGLTPSQLRHYRQVCKHFEYAQPESRIAIELHWRTEHNRFLSPTGDPFAQLEEVALAPQITVPVLPSADLLINLCTHGAGHAWFRLKWLADVAALLALQPSSDRSTLLGSARGCDRPVAQALLLCSALLETPSTGFEPSSTAHSLARTAAAAVQQPIPPGTHEFVPNGLLASLFRLRSSPRYKLEELRIHLASPADWQAIPLPRWAHFAYPLLRFPLWIKRRRAASRP